MRGPRLLTMVALALAAATAPAEAHQTSVKYIDVALDGAAARVRLTVAPGDVTEPLGLPADARPALADALAPPAGARVAAYVQRWLAIGPDGDAPCPPGAPVARADGDARFVVVTWQVACAGELGRIALDLRAFFAIDTRHEAIVTVHPP